MSSLGEIFQYYHVAFLMIKDYDLEFYHTLMSDQHDGKDLILQANDNSTTHAALYLVG